jgi:hypothetical protein
MGIGLFQRPLLLEILNDFADWLGLRGHMLLSSNSPQNNGEGDSGLSLQLAPSLYHVKHHFE